MNFYNGDNQDWSKKLDYSQPHQLLPMGDLQNNPYKFSYKEGGDDTRTRSTKKRILAYMVTEWLILIMILSSKRKKLRSRLSLQSWHQDKAYSGSVITRTRNNMNDSNLRILYYGGAKLTSNGWLLHLQSESCIISKSRPIIH